MNYKDVVKTKVQRRIKELHTMFPLHNMPTLSLLQCVNGRYCISIEVWNTKGQAVIAKRRVYIPKQSSYDVLDLVRLRKDCEA